MPRPPLYATKTTCKHCGWSTVTHQSSDVIMRPDRCARCGATELEHTAASAFETAAARLLWQLRRRRLPPEQGGIHFPGRKRE